MTYFTRQTRRIVSPRRSKARPRPEPLEGRQLLSGFGPEDGAYIVEPWRGGYSDVQIQPGDQKIVAAGSVTSGLAIARYDAAGNADPGYGTAGLSTPTGVGGSQSLVLQPDGKAVVAGNISDGDSSFVVARLHTNGTLDSGFGSGGWNTVNARPSDFNLAKGVGLQSNGKVVVAGTSYHNTIGIGLDSSLAEVARFTASGAVDSGKTGFGKVVWGKAVGYALTGVGMKYTSFMDLAVQADDKLVAVGRAYNAAGSGGPLAVVRYTASGTLDKAFNGKGYTLFLPAGISGASAIGVALQSNGKIVVTGVCTGTDGADDMLVARFNTNGTPDTSFGGGTGYVRLDVATSAQSQEAGKDVAIQPDGKIVAAGATSVAGGPVSILVARFNVDGTPDTTFAPDGYKIGAPVPNTGYHSFEFGGLALQSDGSIIVSGTDDQDSTDAFVGYPFLMRFYSGTQSALLQTAGVVASTPSGTGPLTLAQTQPRLTAGVAGRQASGTTISLLGSLEAIATDQSAVTLDVASGSTITLDTHAAVWGWLTGRSSRRRRMPQADRIDVR